jgi:hypothetical protein
LSALAVLRRHVAVAGGGEDLNATSNQSDAVGRGRIGIPIGLTSALQKSVNQSLDTQWQRKVGSIEGRRATDASTHALAPPTALIQTRWFRRM